MKEKLEVIDILDKMTKARRHHNKSGRVIIKHGNRRNRLEQLAKELKILLI
jgi:hypothetical protein